EKEDVLRAQLDALAAQTLDRQRYLTLAETIESFLVRLRDTAETASIVERQRVLPLLVKEILVGVDRIVIRHCLGIPRHDGTPDYRLRPRRLQPGTDWPLRARAPEPRDRERAPRAPPAAPGGVRRRGPQL